MCRVFGIHIFSLASGSVALVALSEQQLNSLVIWCGESLVEDPTFVVPIALINEEVPKHKKNENQGQPETLSEADREPPEHMSVSDGFVSLSLFVCLLHILVLTERDAPRFHHKNSKTVILSRRYQLHTSRRCEDNVYEMHNAMTSIALSPAPSIIGLGIVAALAAPALCSLCSFWKRTVDRHRVQSIYEDEDGAGTQESVRDFGNKSAKILVALFSLVGVVVATSRLILVLHSDNCPLLSLQPWFHFTAWVGLIRIPPSLSILGTMLTRVMNTEDLFVLRGRYDYCLTTSSHSIQPRPVSITILCGLLRR